MLCFFIVKKWNYLVWGFGNGFLVLKCSKEIICRQQFHDRKKIHFSY